MKQQLNDEYDIANAFKKIEDELISSMIRNFKKHKIDEINDGKRWSMWQAEQLKSLEKYRVQNKKKFKGQFADINKRVKELIKGAKNEGGLKEEKRILQTIKKSFKGKGENSQGITKKNLDAKFFKTNERKLNALIKSTTSDMEKAEISVLRRSNDIYRKVIFDAHVYAQSGAGTYEKAVDMATKDFLKKGIDCIEYKNGARHNISDYSMMAIRTASKRAYLQGEGEKRQEWGQHLVIVNKRGNPCPKCLPFCGKVFIDDVWSGGSKVDGDYPLMSYAIGKGLYHPNCKDSHTTYFEGISTPSNSKFSKKEIEEIQEKNKQEAKERYKKRQSERYERMSKYSLDDENQVRYQQISRFWKNVRFKTGGMDSKEYAISKKTVVPHQDIMKDWLVSSVSFEPNIIDLKEYKVEDTVYKVDGKKILLDYKKEEKDIAELISKTFGEDVCMVPRINEPQGISTADYIFKNERYDLKTISGSSKNTLYNAVSKKKKQSQNFVFDISSTPLSTEEIFLQVDKLYTSKHTMWIDKIIVVKDNKVIRVTKRKRT